MMQKVLFVVLINAYLWIWYDHIELNIPLTSNRIWSLFTDLKTYMRLHNGMTIEHKKVLYINSL